MAKKSAGILLYRFNGKQIEVFLVHPGGPFFKNKDLGSWTIPKGEYEAGEEPLLAALREFEEETGQALKGEFTPLPVVIQKNGKQVSAWAVEGNLDIDKLCSNNFKLEWPPRSGKMQEFPEIDRGGWFSLEEAVEKIIPAQVPLLDALQQPGFK